ncbi:3-oxoacyl-reductase [Aspergillus avenaceus]|uniref:3-oxoacyl-reductase n=1 Tax=Aspergillus avenaceus TaxID=36643 RepID=A0A5N6TKA3_ASPAV|nr:3-oxoacyl-reductase [Aspergillus avenaceus]
MLAEPDKTAGNGGDAPKLRAACENCRQSKVKCNLGGKDTCIRCNRHGLQCRYRAANRSGKPKGSKNRATLRKLGQLQETSAMQDPPGHRAGPGGRGEIPLSQASTATACGLLNEPHMEYSTFYRDPLSDATNAAFMSPTFLQKEFITKGLTTFPLAVHIPNVLQPACDCGEALGFHTTRLQNLVNDPVHTRFDFSLQTVRAALAVCRVFLQCHTCHKDNSNAILPVTTLGLTSQFFEYCISYQCTAHICTGNDGVGYGEYEMSPEEARRVRRMLIRGRLHQWKDVITLLKESVDLSGSTDLEGNWLQHVVRGYEATVEAFLQKMSHRLTQLKTHLTHPHGLLAHKTALITGAGQGIGAETAQLFANEGAKVIIADIDSEKANSVATSINTRLGNGRAVAVVGNILDEKYIAELVERAGEFGDGKIHILVNNAGFTWDGVIHKMTDQQWDTMLAVHNTAPFKLVRAAAKYFRVKDGESRVIVNISSTSGIHGNAGQANYALAKAGLVGLTKTIAKEWGPAFGVRANTIAFGHVQTRLTAAKEDGAFVTAPDGTKVPLGIPGKQLEARKGRNEKQAYPDIPLGRPATPEEAAKSILAVASPLFSYVTGETIRVTGGRNM